ncbi:hypothetical protein HHJ81_01725 [Mobiluncus mulieris]|uniref:Uncharacterized protein n=1 Tax=Mobiluncus mulieris TaxID=2052 RepID=A0A7Y0U0X4_9ACTO|nr:hypothetical protein [Mobiluncus mulieris]NMW59830.1 hypothetical protein [Mobiluncus mulieris]NMW62557.1 hypothetical protein [Mobiluncus mulieris]NMW64767.1 hypothetical protein [Mobiluncus mulieris]NMW93460.1 hypothetical protein [Mobiluncus mulieris]
MRFLDKTESVTDYNFDYLVEDTASTQNWPAFYRTGQVRARQWYRYGHEIPPQRPVIPTAPTTPAAVFDTGVSL